MLVINFYAKRFTCVGWGKRSGIGRDRARGATDRCSGPFRPIFGGEWWLGISSNIIFELPEIFSFWLVLAGFLVQKRGFCWIIRKIEPGGPAG